MKMAASTSGHVEGIMSNVVIVAKENAQNLRKWFEDSGYWDSYRKLKSLSNGTVVIPIKEESTSSLTRFYNTTSGEHCVDGIIFKLDKMTLESSRKATQKSPHSLLIDTIKSLLTNQGKEWLDDLEVDLPGSWEKHGDLLMLPCKCFQNPVWTECGDDLWKAVAEALGCRRVAKKDVITSDSFRSPQVSLLHGDHGWVDQVDNNIKCSYDATKCMFSSGNITEKLRIARFNCEGETVVDLYAGIGYFTLPYLVHAKAAMVHACEWNPHAVTALRYNLKQNQVTDRCVVHVGDNRQVCPLGVADRVNLGLIPSSEPGWEPACAALKPTTGGMLHVHGNVITSRLLSNETTLTVIGDEFGNAVIKVKNETENSKDSQRNRHILNDKSSNRQFDEGGEIEENCSQSEISEHVSCTSPVRGKNSCGRGNSKVENGEAHTKVPSENGVTETHTCIGHAKDSIDTLDEKINQTDQSVTNKQGIVQHSRKQQWHIWGQHVADRIAQILTDVHGGQWTTTVCHIEHVKSYAPNNDHLVVDIECRPQHKLNS